MAKREFGYQKDAPKKSPAQLQREIDEVLAHPGKYSYEEAMGALEKKHAGVPRGGSLRSGHAPVVPESILKIGDAVQFRSEPGTGGVIRRFESDGWARVATPRGERSVPTDALRLVRKEHEARVRRSVSGT